MRRPRKSASRVGGYVPAPNALPAFPDAYKVKGKTPMPGGARRRWQDDRCIYEWDYLHGAVERYSRRGEHLGEFDAATGEMLKGPVPGRRIEP